MGMESAREAEDGCQRPRCKCLSQQLGRCRYAASYGIRVRCRGRPRDHTEGYADRERDCAAGIVGFVTNTNVQSSSATAEWVHLGAKGWNTRGMPRQWERIAWSKNREPERDAPSGWKYQFATLD